MAYLEHANVTVADPRATAEMLCDLFEWTIRWEGEAMSGGFTIHVGNDTSYMAVYSGDPTKGPLAEPAPRYSVTGGLNHIGVVVEDLDVVLRKALDRGYVPGEVHDYEPGRRFYFLEENGIEIEVVCY